MCSDERKGYTSYLKGLGAHECLVLRTQLHQNETCLWHFAIKLPVLQKVVLTENIQQLHEINTAVLSLKVMPHCVIIQQMSQDYPFIMMCVRNYNEYELDVNLINIKEIPCFLQCSQVTLIQHWQDWKSTGLSNSIYCDLISYR